MTGPGDTAAIRYLVGQTVLIVHDDPFQASYLADVIRRSGAAIAGPVRTISEGIRLSEAVASPTAIVLSTSARGDDMASIMAVAAARSIVILILYPTRAGAVAEVFGRRNLVAPYAGFQVVEALRTLLNEGSVT